jgi:hypothetical protein
MPTEFQKGVDLPYIPGTNQYDAVYALYSNQSLDPSDDKWDPYNVTMYSNDANSSPLPEIKIIIPEGYRDILSLDTKT